MSGDVARTVLDIQVEIATMVALLGEEDGFRQRKTSEEIRPLVKNRSSQKRYSDVFVSGTQTSICIAWVPVLYRSEIVPTVSRFYGILIRQYNDEHGVPHFHAKYGEYEAVYEIDTITVIEGALPSNKRKLVEAWAIIHKRELEANFELIQDEKSPKKIKPLR